MPSPRASKTRPLALCGAREFARLCYFARRICHGCREAWRCVFCGVSAGLMARAKEEREMAGPQVPLNDLGSRANGELDEALRWLSAPATYAERPSRVLTRETHISWVFLTDR